MMTRLAVKDVRGSMYSVGGSEHKDTVVTVYFLVLKAVTAFNLELFCCLSPEEQLKYKQFPTAIQAKRYLYSRGYLRQLLAQWLGCSPEKIFLKPDSLGKPNVIVPASPVCGFNVSHADGVIVWGIVNEGRLGIDIEQNDKSVMLGLMKDKIVTPSEKLSAHSAFTQSDLLEMWVLKEALLKGLGVGLSWSMNQLEVVRHGRHVTYRGFEGADCWCAYFAECMKGYTCAVAWERSGARGWCGKVDASECAGMHSVQVA